MEETYDIDCPWCGEPNTVFLDLSVSSQKYIEDCQVCCRPIDFLVEADPLSVSVGRS